MTLARWPAHPSLIQGERLSSWLRRIAAVYGLSVQELLKWGLGFPNPQADRLDVRPANDLIKAISLRAGVRPEDIRRTTAAGMFPFLLCNSDPDCTTHRSVLLATASKPLRSLCEWVAWLRKESAEPLMACRLCLKNYPNAGIMLPWRLIVMLCCPLHGLMLEPARITMESVEWLNEAPEVAPDVVRSLDRRTWIALTTGTVKLPGGSITAALWLRMLQTIREELNKPFYRASEWQLVKAVWTAADCCPKAGNTFWKPFQFLHPHRRRAMLLATAIDMIERGLIVPAGADATRYFLCRKPECVPGSMGAASPADFFSR